MSLHKAITIRAVSDPVTKLGEIRGQFRWLTPLKQSTNQDVMLVFRVSVLLGDECHGAAY